MLLQQLLAVATLQARPLNTLTHPIRHEQSVSARLQRPLSRWASNRPRNSVSLTTLAINHTEGSRSIDAALRAAAHLELIATDESNSSVTLTLTGPPLAPLGLEHPLKPSPAADVSPAPKPSPDILSLVQTGGSSVLMPTPTPFDILTAQPIPRRGGWETYPPEPDTPLRFPEPPPAPVPLFSLRLIELAAWSGDQLRVSPCADVHEGMVLALGMGGPSEEYVRVRTSNCSAEQRPDGSSASVLDVRLDKPLRFEHGDGEQADAMPALFQIPTHRLHVRWEPPPPAEYLRALALANRAAEWIKSHASRSPTRWAPRDIALALALALLASSAALLLLACVLLGARSWARWWVSMRLAQKQLAHLGKS